MFAERLAVGGGGGGGDLFPMAWHTEPSVPSVTRIGADPSFVRGGKGTTLSDLVRGLDRWWPGKRRSAKISLAPLNEGPNRQASSSHFERARVSLACAGLEIQNADIRDGMSPGRSGKWQLGHPKASERLLRAAGG